MASLPYAITCCPGHIRYPKIPLKESPCNKLKNINYISHWLATPNKLPIRSITDPNTMKKTKAHRIAQTLSPSTNSSFLFSIHFEFSNGQKI